MFEAGGRMFSVDAAGDGAAVTNELLKTLCPSVLEEQAAKAAAAAKDAEAAAAVQLPPVLRLFVIHEDGSGLELLRPDDVASYIASKKADHCSEIIKEPQPGDESQSNWLAFFTQKEPVKFDTPACGLHNKVPK